MARRPARPLARDPVADARAAWQAANRQLGRHFMECARCVHAGRDLTKFCDAGYQLAKVIHRTGRELERAKAARLQPAGQGTLW